MTEPIAAVVVVSPSRKSVRLHNYVSTEKEGQKKGDRFVAQSGLNGCIPEFAERQFRDNRKRWGKNGERRVKRGRRKYTEGQYVQAYHVIQSFARDGVGSLDPSNPDDWEKAHELGIALARRLAGRGRMATVTTQIDGKTGCIHNHIVIDSVDKLTGRSFDSANVKHKVLATTNDEVLLEEGYQQVNTLTNGIEKVEKSELRALAKHVAWRAEPTSSPEPFSVAVLKDRVFDAMNYHTSVDWDSFVRTCENLGVEVLRSTARNGRGISYRMLRLDGTDGGGYLPGSPGDVRRAGKLGTRFTMDAVEATLKSNFRAAQRRQATTAQPTHAPTATVPQRDDKATPYASAPGMGDGVRSQELDEEPTSFATASDMPAPKSVLRGAIDDDDYESVFGSLYAEWEAEREAKMPGLLAGIKSGQLGQETDSEKLTEAPQTAQKPEPVSKPIETRSGPQEGVQGASSTAAGAPLSQAKKADSFADLWAEWEASREQRVAQIMADMGLGKSLEQIDAEKLAEAPQTAQKTEPVPEPIETAPEPQEGVQGASSTAAGAPLSQGANRKHRSLLRNVWLRSMQRQRVIDDMIVFEEDAVAILDAGGDFPGSAVPEGVGRDFLDRYGKKLSPKVLPFLEQRQAKLEAATAVWYDDPNETKRMRAEVAAGNYDFVEQKPGQKMPKVRGVPQQKSDENDLSLK